LSHGGTRSFKALEDPALIQRRARDRRAGGRHATTDPNKASRKGWGFRARISLFVCKKSIGRAPHRRPKRTFFRSMSCAKPHAPSCSRNRVRGTRASCKNRKTRTETDRPPIWRLAGNTDTRFSPVCARRAENSRGTSSSVSGAWFRTCWSKGDPGQRRQNRHRHSIPSNGNQSAVHGTLTIKRLLQCRPREKLLLQGRNHPAGLRANPARAAGPPRTRGAYGSFHGYRGLPALFRVRRQFLL